ncbi:MAG: 2TM domain-containing protein [Rhodobacteraceae bacterium]|nr:2TM domain-containing protein [Paracoccaceae bacterium]
MRACGEAGYTRQVYPEAETMTDQEAYDRARKRAKKKLEFYNHVIVYAVVNGFLFAINLFTSPGYLWAVWPLMGWGIGLALHGVTVFLRTDDEELLDRMTERELGRDKTRNRPEP